jgi:PAS domain S-box-containing protein
MSINCNKKHHIIVVTAAGLLFTLLSGLVWPGSTELAPTKHVVAAVPQNFPPHYTVDSAGNPGGFAIEVMDKVAEQAGLQVTYKVLPEWPQVFEALRNGDVDLIPNIGITAERQQYFAFSIPLESFSIAMFVRDSTDDIRQFKDLKGRAVGALAGNVAIKLFHQKGIQELQIYSDIESALFALLSGQLDVLVSPDTVAWKLARLARVDNRIKVVGKPLMEIKRAIAVRKGEEVLLQRLNKTLETFLSGDTYKDIYRKWHGTPTPFWTPARLTWFFMALLALVISFMAYWRYRSLISINNNLRQSIENQIAAEERLRDSEERFRSIAAVVQDAVIMIDSDGIIVYWNPAAEAILGYAVQEALGKEMHALLAPERYQEAAWKGMHVFSENGTGPIINKVQEVDVLNRDGREFPAELTVSSLKLEDKWHAVGVIRDITARKKAENLLEEAKLRYRTVADFTYDWVYWIRPDGTFQYMSPSCERVTGYSVDEFMDNPLLMKDIMLSEDAYVWKEHTHGLEETGSAHHVRFRIQRKDGAIRWLEHACRPVIDEAGQFQGYRVSNRDISERVEAELALQQSEERYRTLFDTANDAIFIMEGECFIDCNPETSRMFGCSREDIIGKTPMDFSPATQPDGRDSREKAMARINEAMAGKPQNFEWSHTRLDGTPFATEISLNSMEVAGRVLIQAICRNITERKRAEAKIHELNEELEQRVLDRTRALSESEERFRSVVQLVPDIIYRLDQKGRFMLLSESVHVLGYTPDELIGQHFSVLMLPDEARSVTREHVVSDDGIDPGDGCKLFDERRKGVRATSGLRIRLLPKTERERLHEVKDPTQLNMLFVEVNSEGVYINNGTDTSKKFVGTVGAIRDITERKQAEDALRDSEARLRRAVTEAPFPVMIHADDGKVLSISKTWSEITGYGVEDIPTIADWTEKGYRARREHVNELIDTIFQSEGRTHDGETVIYTRKGEQRVWDFSSAPLGRLQDGRRAVISMAMDVTKRKQAEQELNQLNTTLEARVIERTLELDRANKELEKAIQELKDTQARIIQTEKLTALGTMAAGVAHELNNPMMGIMNYVEYADRVVKEPKAKQALSKANSELRRMADIVRNMLTFARPGGKELAQVDVADIVKRTLQLLASDLRHQNVEVTKDIPASLPPVWARIDGLVQVFLNLFINATDAMAEGEEKVIQIRAFPENESVIVEIQDTGKGIPDYILGRVFDPFFTTKEVGKGTGLGLSVSRNIVIGFGGSLTCRSTEGEGATFRLVLPTTRQTDAVTGSNNRDSD